MDFDPTEDQKMMVEAVARLSADALAPILAREPASQPLSKAVMAEIYGHLAGFGLTAMRLPVELGGSGMSMVDYGLMIGELPPAVALSLVSHDGSTVRMATGAPEDLRQRHLNELIAGRKIICTATSEPEAGSNSNAIRTRVTFDGETARISGRKMWITNASVADLFIVTCTSGTDAAGKPLNHRMLVERDRPGVTVTEIPLTGLRQGHLSEVNFEDVVVPADHAIGEPGDAGKLMTLVWNGNRPLLGLIALGIARRALALAQEHCATRRQFGRPLAAMQLVQQDLSEIEMLIESARLTCLSALHAMDMGRRANGASAMAKRLATGNAVRAIDLAMQLHGALGITEEMGLEQMWRDARIFQVPDGTMGILSLIHGREMTGMAAF
ncbi:MULTISPECIES: acyl-CoA dehydrogenase family protein [Salipiger]|uniref:Acyl-CoA dehydrogenase n=1 Tax=Salipiger profundus TaxID=1229727 RepID=A0A1U7DDH4_9RHOB|nr:MULTISPECIES: acyl-CoA dehydrogenase family protein [Salipiger]APX26162.1 acyl-CoA dehydrogenase [Salipiger profundus]GGA23519.1 putative acyl-CoA dehydrogenase YngJ [Salipiger profundus]